MTDPRVLDRVLKMSKAEILEFIPGKCTYHYRILCDFGDIDEKIIRKIWDCGSKDLQTQIGILRLYRLCPIDIKNEIYKLSPGIENRHTGSGS